MNTNEMALVMVKALGLTILAVFLLPFAIALGLNLPF